MNDEILKKLQEQQEKLKDWKTSLDNAYNRYPNIHNNLDQILSNLDKIGEKLKGNNDGSGGIKVDEMEAELNQARLKIRELEDQIKNIGQEVDKVNKGIEDIGDLPDKIKEEQIKVENKVQDISVKALAIVGVFSLTYWIIVGIKNWVIKGKK